MSESREFVNSVWYIKILSPLEVQEMGKEDLTNSAVQSHMLNGCDDYTNRNDSRNTTFNGIPSVGSLDFWTDAVQLR